MKHCEPMIYVVDDDSSVLRAVARLLRTAGFNVSTFASAREFIEGVDLNVHGCIVLDIAMPECGGLELQRSLTEKGSNLPIVFLTGHADVPMSVRAMKAGAVDLLTKPIEAKELVYAVSVAIARNRVARDAAMEVAAIRQRLAKLTPREYEVFEHVVCGQLNKETAAEMGTVEKTVKVHRARVMEKLEVSSLADLVRLAERAGIYTVTASK